MIKFLPRIVLVFLLCSANSYGQEAKFWNWKNFKVRKAFESKTNDDNNPALFSITMPKEKDDFLLVNAGIGYSYADESKKKFKYDITAFFVFNQNNQIDKEQLNHKIGVASTETFLLEKDNLLFGTQALQYLNNIQEKSKSLLLTSYWQYYNKKNKIKIGGYAPDSKKRCLFNLSPMVGAEYQNTYKADEVLAEGYAFRGYFNLGANFLIRRLP